MLTVQLALRVWLSVEAAGLASCCQQWSHWGWKEGGGMCYDCGGLAAAVRVAASLPVTASSPGTHCSRSSSSTCSSRKKRHWLSVASSQAMRAFLSECIWAVLVTQTHLVKKCFSWTFYTEAVWKWVTLSQILSLYFVASRSELLACCAWLASWHYLRIVCWETVKKWVPLACGYHIPDVCLPFWLEGGNLLVWFIVCLAPFLCRQGKICTSDLSALTFYDELSLVKEKSKTVLNSWSTLCLAFINQTCLMCRKCCP